MRLPPIAIGDILHVTFLDHAEGHNEICFEVFGRVAFKDRTKIVIVCWGYIEADQIDDNVHCYTILRSAITAVKKLK
jgi:hypothetical protein